MNTSSGSNSQSCRPIWIAQVGNTVETVRARRGDFDDWIRAGLGRSAAEVRVVRPHADEPLPDGAELDDAAGVVVTGSAAMITDEEPWSVRTEAWLAEVLARGVPVLGICYGHQMLARVGGGRVDWNPRGREIGTVEVEVAAAGAEDALFGALPRTLVVQTTHSQGVVELPPAATALASNAHEPFQAFALGPAAWGVQFHPEFDADVLRGYLEERSEAIDGEGLDVEALAAGLRDSEHGRLLLRRFDALARERA